MIAGFAIVGGVVLLVGAYRLGSVKNAVVAAVRRMICPCRCTGSPRPDR
jgi:hypothetical protein